MTARVAHLRTHVTGPLPPEDRHRPERIPRTLLDANE